MQTRERKAGRQPWKVRRQGKQAGKVTWGRNAHKHRQPRQGKQTWYTGKAWQVLQVGRLGGKAGPADRQGKHEAHHTTQCMGWQRRARKR